MLAIIDSPRIWSTSTTHSTPDGVFNNNVGHDAIVKFANTFHAGLGAHVRHWNQSHDSARAPRGQVYLVLVDFGTKPASMATSASYLDELVRTAHGWRFKKRVTKGDVAPPTQAVSTKDTKVAKDTQGITSR